MKKNKKVEKKVGVKKKWGKKISSKTVVKIRLNMGKNKLWLEAVCESRPF